MAEGGKEAADSISGRLSNTGCGMVGFLGWEKGGQEDEAGGLGGKAQGRAQAAPRAACQTRAVDNIGQKELDGLGGGQAGGGGRFFKQWQCSECKQVLRYQIMVHLCSTKMRTQHPPAGRWPPPSRLPGTLAGAGHAPEAGRRGRGGGREEGDVRRCR